MLHPYFTDHVVLQRGSTFPILGRVEPGEKVVVELRGRTYSAIADAHGRWRALLDLSEPCDISRSRLDVTRARGERVTLCAAIGDIWVCSGQSNMGMPLSATERAVDRIAESHAPDIHLLSIPHHVSDVPQDAFDGDGWQVCSPETSANFSALAYYFGRHLQPALQVPLGLIHASVGATPAEAWTTVATLESDADFQPILDRWRQSLQDHPHEKARYERDFAAFSAALDAAERAGRPLRGVHPRLIGPGDKWTPQGLYNGMIAPLTQFPIHGVLWYQGAAAPETAYQYRKLFPALIRQWRSAWGREDLPFIYAQEANFGPRRDEPCEHSWAELREAQAMAMALEHTAMAVALEHTAMAVAIDLGEATDIHPPRKQPLGQRMALAARATAYGEDVAWSGPRYASMSIEGGCIRIRFTHCVGPLTTSDGGAVRGFAVSPGATDFTSGHRGFAWAEARLEGDSVVVWSDRVACPVAVRYAWAQNPACNLTDASGLPAAPFRTDDWPGVTAGNA